MAISDEEFAVLQAQVQDIDGRLLTLETTIAIANQTTTSRLNNIDNTLVTINTALLGIANEISQLKQKNSEIVDRLDGLDVKTTVDRFKINRIDRRRKGLI